LFDCLTSVSSIFCKRGFGEKFGLENRNDVPHPEKGVLVKMCRILKLKILKKINKKIKKKMNIFKKKIKLYLFCPTNFY
jgi:hypothetical protein